MNKISDVSKIGNAWFLVQMPGILTTAGLFVFGCPDFNSIKDVRAKFF